MKNKKIIVIGSTNTDMVVKSPRIPAPGETILGGNFFMNAGGKGANQAVASARLGGDVTFIAKIGNDLFGKQALELFNNEGINCSHLFVDETAPSGVAMITLDAKGENCIVVALGANNNLTADEVLSAGAEFKAADVVLMQLETPIDTVLKTAEASFLLGKKVILNPAPACELPAELFKNLFLITPNETEAEILTGVVVTDTASATKAAMELQKMGVQHVIITLGMQGALLYSEGKGQLIPSRKVEAIDTTAAGDTFNGALAVAIAQGKSLTEAVAFGNQAAAISVTRLGAQTSVPYLHELTINN
jgi:ribokinase